MPAMLATSITHIAYLDKEYMCVMLTITCMLNKCILRCTHAWDKMHMCTCLALYLSSTILVSLLFIEILTSLLNFYLFLVCHLFALRPTT